ncbi:MAG TPA: HD domain-containing protein [Rhabdochlamydiaceae bacterium]|nr:HD domain-containing protein [Rhabdochlamydiaceae bacterium]
MRAFNLVSGWKSPSSKHWRWIVRFLLFPFFVILLACLLHFREVRVDHLELNEIAGKYVLAQLGFEFPDVEATRLLKEESLRDIGRIYCFDDDQVLSAEKKIQKQLINKPEWRKELPGVTFEELLNASDAVRDVLMYVDIADARTVSKVNQFSEIKDDYQFLVFVPENLTGKIPTEVFKQVAEFNTPALEYMSHLYGEQSWTLIEDLTSQNAIRQIIKDTIPLKMTRVEAGSRIVNAGEKVTLRHLDMMKAMKRTLFNQQFRMTPMALLGSLGFAAILTFIGIAYFRTVHPHLLRSSSKMSLIGAVIVFSLSIAKLTEFLVINSSLSDFCRYPIFVLFASFTLSILLDKGVAMITSGFIAMVLAISLAMEYNHFLIINLSTAVISLFLIKTVRKRKEIFGVCGKIWLMTIPLLTAISFVENSSWFHLLADVATTFISVFVTGILVVAILPLIEAGFGIVTDMTLMETGDPSHPLLRRLSLEAPGTYQHSLGVATLAEEAAIAIGANGIFCRVAALYHDVGKLGQPHYFTENQFSGFNMHQLLTPLESAQLIIDHVTEGVKLAMQYELPEAVIDVIREHHGTGLVYYFYHAQMEQCRLRTNLVEEAQFRYPGPTPRSRESAIIMIADSVEAAFRSLDETTEKAVIELVDTIVIDKIRQHQLDSSYLTFQEIEVVKKALIRILVAISHGRVKYPEPQPAESWEEAILKL